MEEFTSALRRLKAFNRMVAHHPELSARLVGGEHDFLQWRQASLFSAFREYHLRPVEALRVAETEAKITPGLAAAGLVACALTAWAAAFRKADVMVFSVDKISSKGGRDFRLEGLYRFLETEGLAYVEIFHARLGRAFFRHAWARKRSAVYHEAFDFAAMIRFRHRGDAEARRIASALPCEEFDEADRPFVRALAEKMLRGIVVSRFRIRWYSRVIARLRPKALLSIDATRHYHEACAAARSLGIPFHAFQHGHFTKYHVGWFSAEAGGSDGMRPDTLHVWSPYWKKELLRLGTNFKEGEIRIGGDPKGDMKSSEAKPYIPPPVDGPIELLVPFETEAPRDEIVRDLKKLADSGKVKIWLKTRPDWDVRVQMRLYGLEGADPARAEAVADAASVLDRIHAVLGVYTSYLYDVLAMRKPVFVLKTSMDGLDGMVLNGLADGFDASAPDAAKRLADACREAAPKLAERAAKYLEGSGDLMTTLEGLGLGGSKERRR